MSYEFSGTTLQRKPKIQPKCTLFSKQIPLIRERSHTKLAPLLGQAWRVGDLDVQGKP